MQAWRVVVGGTPDASHAAALAGPAPEPSGESLTGCPKAFAVKHLGSRSAHPLIPQDDDAVLIGVQRLTRDNSDASDVDHLTDRAGAGLRALPRVRTQSLDAHRKPIQSHGVPHRAVDDQTRPATVHGQTGDQITDQRRTQRATSINHQDASGRLSRVTQGGFEQPVVLEALQRNHWPAKPTPQTEGPELDRNRVEILTVGVDQVSGGGQIFLAHPGSLLSHQHAPLWRALDT